MKTARYNAPPKISDVARENPIGVRGWGDDGCIYLLDEIVQETVRLRDLPPADAAEALRLCRLATEIESALRSIFETAWRRREGVSDGT